LNDCFSGISSDGETRKGTKIGIPGKKAKKSPDYNNIRYPVSATDAE